MNHFDAIILGSGQAGNPLARYLTSKGLNIALVERSEIGGTCVNVGCTPTKTMVASAKMAYQIRRSGDFGVNAGLVKVDMEKVKARTQEIVLSSRSSNQKSFENLSNLEFIRGEARFLGNHAVHIDVASGQERIISGEKIYINTGCRPIIPPIEGLLDVPYFTSESIFSLDHLPKHLIIIGAGYIALEFAQIFRRFGSEVTVISHGGEFLPREDEDISQLLLQVLEGEGIGFRFHADTQKVIKEGDEIGLEYLLQGERLFLMGSHLLLATGRTPNIPKNPELQGIELNSKGFIKVNPYLETSSKGIFALGDVNGGPNFTHISYDDFRIIRDNFENPESHSTQGRLLNYCLFTDPELGRIGLNEIEAKQLNLDYKVCRLPMAHVARAIEMDETKGMMKAIIDNKTHKILGATVLGIGGGELAATLQVAMKGNLSMSDLHNFIFAHPTLLESFNNLFAKTE